MSNKTLVVLGTGGTIAGQASTSHDNVHYTAGTVPVQRLLGGVRVPNGCLVEAEQVAQIDSKDMGPEVWRPLLARVKFHLDRVDVQGVVITHGTDTLEETAYLLQTVLQPGKPVVLASAMRPASALVPDGPQNLQDALVVAAWPRAQGVLAVCAGKIHSGLAVQKVHPYRLDAFDSGEAGLVGMVEEGNVRLLCGWPASTDAGDMLLDRLLALDSWPRVEWLSSHGGATGALVLALLAQRELALSGQSPNATAVLQGIVVAGTGNGTVHEALRCALEHAQAQGVRVWVTTRCYQGQVVSAGHGCDAMAVTHLPPAKARLALMLALV